MLECNRERCHTIQYFLAVDTVLRLLDNFLVPLLYCLFLRITSQDNSIRWGLQD
jgi:hypothetical protein